MSGEYELRVTRRRALDDIGFGDFAGAGFDLEENRSRHSILHAFASKRSQSPVGQEQTLGIKAPAYNLHSRTNSPLCDFAEGAAFYGSDTFDPAHGPGVRRTTENGTAT